MAKCEMHADADRFRVPATGQTVIHRGVGEASGRSSSARDAEIGIGIPAEWVTRTPGATHGSMFTRASGRRCEPNAPVARVVDDYTEARASPADSRTPE
jgi:hypothetical protein